MKIVNSNVKIEVAMQKRQEVKVKILLCLQATTQALQMMFTFEPRVESIFGAHTPNSS